MKIVNTLLATVAVLAIAGPAFAQITPLLNNGKTSKEVQVKTTVPAGCALNADTLSDFNLSVSQNGQITGVTAPQRISVICNTPLGLIQIGSNDMRNNATIIASETSQFSNFINFTAFADDPNSGFILDSRDNGRNSNQATVGEGTAQMTRSLDIGIEDIRVRGDLRPVAGAYVGAVCVSIDPANLLVGSAASNMGNRACAGGSPF